MKSEKDIVHDAITALWNLWVCVRSGGHDFDDAFFCRRCGAAKDGKSLADILAEKGSKP